MRVSTKILLITTIGVTAYFAGLRRRSSADRTPSAVQSFSGTANFSPSTSGDAGASALQSSRFQRPSAPLAAVRISLQLKLRRWEESQVDSPDDEEGRDQLLQEMLALVTDENVAELIQSLSVEQMQSPFGIDALHRWMRVTPVVASNWLAARSDRTSEQTFTVANEWIDNRAALQTYLDQLPDAAWKQGLLEATSSVTSTKDPQGAIKLAENMHPGEAQTNLLQAVTCSWVDTDPVAALDWVAAVKSPALRERLIASAFQSYALTDPLHAATWLISDVKSENVLNGAALNILGTWVTKNPAEAANWAAQFPEGDIKATAVKIVSDYWRQTDPVAATAWMQNLPENLPN